MNLFSYAISRSIGIPKQQPLPGTSKPTEVPSTEPTWTPLEQTTSNNTDSRPIGPPRASTSQAASQTSRSASGSKIKGKAPALTIVTEKNAVKSKQSQLQQTRLSGRVSETVSEGEVVPLVVTARGDKEVLIASSAFESSKLLKRPAPPSPVGDNPAKKRRVETSASREEHSPVQSASSSRPLTRTRAERARTVSTASSNDPELDDLLPESYANLISKKKLPTPRRNSIGKSQTISPTASKYPNRLRPRLPSPTPSADSPTFGRRSNDSPVANSAAANERLLKSLFSPSGDQDRSSSNILQQLVNAQASRIIDYVQNRGCGDIMLKMKVLDLKTRLSELDKLTEERDNPGRSGNSGKDRLIGKLKDMVLTAQEEMVEIVQKEGCPDIELKLMILDLNTRLTEFKKVGQGS
ncbi:hypothetical protein PHLCEN_2v12927 [Hermanssonia centrifuga]|uniref:Uncharacterized protein n=1 Tax=Hermanssonia centrifuga TaxID=98765 RepID=A0A2R6NFN4_9APHY|nr:hypothetical protein PHLCEN_2v12927 [Hermanssonia centrifuga]